MTRCDNCAATLHEEFQPLTFRREMSYCFNPFKKTTPRNQGVCLQLTYPRILSCRKFCRWQHLFWSSLECAWERMKLSRKGITRWHVYAYSTGRLNPWLWRLILELTARAAGKYLHALLWHFVHRLRGSENREQQMLMFVMKEEGKVDVNYTSIPPCW